MKRFAVLLLALVATPALAWHGHARPIAERQAAQQARIADGVAHGQLTACEASRLQGRSAAIERRERRYRATGGLGPAERADLERRLDAVSRDIAEQRRDGRGCW
ncbi:MAG TPA: hypothetical protein VFL14_08490 [Xanthomonadales bacterium]|nr:hypothetical protein [Xanthomonadales bacterium]